MICPWCEQLWTPRRSDQEVCSTKCRKARWKLRRHIRIRALAAQPMRIGVLDPPYPNKAYHYRNHADYGGEVPLIDVFEQTRGLDGWVIATSGESEGLQAAVVLAHQLGIACEVGIWVKGDRPQARSSTRAAFEAVLYKSARPWPREGSGVDTLVWPEALVCGKATRTSDPRRVIGAKPGPWWDWVFTLMGAAPNDDFTDFYPGSNRGRMCFDAMREAA